MQKEEWRDVVGYEGVYAVSNKGRIKRTGWGYGTYEGRMLSPNTTVWGYKSIHLSRNSVVRPYSVHSLVMRAFVGERPAGYDINHKNGDKTDNRLENLEYVTRAYNRQHAYDTGLQTAQGEKNSQCKLTEHDVAKIRQMYATGEYLHRELADMFGVTRRTIGDIVQRRSWKHL